MSTTKSKETEAPEEGAHAFNTMLARIDDGALHAELSEAVVELVKKCDEHANMFGKAKGELTLKLSFGVENGVVIIRGDVKTKAPPPKRGQSVFWMTKAFNLTPKNPKQLEFGAVREVPAGGGAREAKKTETEARSV